MELSTKNYDLLNKLISMCTELNRDDFHVFLRFSGHVNMIDIGVHYGGYNEKKEESKICSFYLDSNTLDDHKNLSKKLKKSIFDLMEANLENSHRKDLIEHALEEQEKKELARLQAKYAA